jgi:hypothetical protein
MTIFTYMHHNRSVCDDCGSRTRSSPHPASHPPRALRPKITSSPRETPRLARTRNVLVVYAIVPILVLRWLNMGQISSSVALTRPKMVLTCLPFSSSTAKKHGVQVLFVKRFKQRCSSSSIEQSQLSTEKCRRANFWLDVRRLTDQRLVAQRALNTQGCTHRTRSKLWVPRVETPSPLRSTRSAGMQLVPPAQSLGSLVPRGLQNRQPQRGS